MQSSKLVLILKALHPDEMVRLRKFIRSPYFADVKQKIKIQKLFDLLQKEYPQFDRPSFHKKQVFDMLFRGETFSASKLDKLMSGLLRLIKQFILFEQLQLDTAHQKLELARFYRRRQLTKAFRESIRALKKSQQSSRHTDKDDYLYRFLTEREISDFEGLFNRRKESLNLPETLQSLDQFYLAAKLEYACQLLSQQSSATPLNIQENLISAEPVKLLMNSKSGMEEPLILMYYQAFLLLSDQDDPEAYERLKSLLLQYESEISFEQIQAFQIVCRNFCARQYNRGDHTYLDELFYLYKDHLERGFLYYNQGLRPSTLKNIMTLGLKLRQFDWVFRFLENHKDRIVGTSHQEDIYRFNLALYYFALKEYDSALDHLADKYEDTYYRMAARRLELKVYYEQKSVLLQPKIEAFKIFLFRSSRKLLTDLHRRGNNNFIDLLKQIYNPKTLKNEVRIQKLISRVNSRKTILEAQWLLEKLEELR